MQSELSTWTRARLVDVVVLGTELKHLFVLWKQNIVVKGFLQRSVDTQRCRVF